MGDKHPSGDECDTIELPNLGYGEKYEVNVFVYYANIGRTDMANAGVKIVQREIKFDTMMILTAQLYGTNAKTLFDTTTFSNYKDTYSLYYSEGIRWSIQANYNLEMCEGTRYAIDVSRDIIYGKEGHNLGSLGNDLCDEGIIWLKLTVINDKYIPQTVIGQ